MSYGWSFDLDPGDDEEMHFRFVGNLETWNFDWIFETKALEIV